jgi:hypothetical protein
MSPLARFAEVRLAKVGESVDVSQSGDPLDHLTVLSDKSLNCFRKKSLATAAFCQERQPGLPNCYLTAIVSSRLPRPIPYARELRKLSYPRPGSATVEGAPGWPAG